MKTWSLFLTSLVLFAVPAAAQPTPTAPAPGSVYPAPATLTKEQLPSAVRFARASKGFPAVPDKVAPAVVANLDLFASQAEQTRRELDNAALALNALQSDDMKALIGETERQQLIKQMTDDFNNRSATLDKLGAAFMDTLPKPAPIGQPKYTGPSIGLPSRPTRPAYVPRSAAGIIAEKGFPGGPGAQLNPVTKAISQGWTAGAWMGNEVLIKEELRQSWKAQDDLKKAQADWDKNVKPQWEENRRNERVDRERADAERAKQAPTMIRIFQSIYSQRPFIVPPPAPTAPKPTTTSSLPALPPSFGSPGGYGGLGGYGAMGGNGPHGGGMGNHGYSGNRYGSTGTGGNGPYGGGGGMGGYGSAGYAGGAGMGGTSPFRR